MRESMRKISIREKCWAALLCLMASAVLLLLCSQCSPLYPINVWVDANCIFTVGRVMKEGAVLYRDIYEQKGPMLYLIHAVSACISDSSFLGVYVMEVISFAAALYAACILVMRRANMLMAVGSCVLIGASLLISRAFSFGDSAEEFCLPYLMGALTISFCQYGESDGPMRPRALFVCGLCAGMVAMIKFTILGLFVGLCLAEGIMALRSGGFARAIRSAAVFLAGMLMPAAAWCAYFAWHGALKDFYQSYLYNNIFLYNAEARSLIDMAYSVYVTMRGNPIWVFAAAAGMLALLADRREKWQLRLAVLAMAAGAFAAVFCLGNIWPYYPLVLGVFAFAGLGTACSFAERWLKTKALRRASCAGMCALALAAAVLLSPNAYLRGVPKEELAQTKLAAHIGEDDTLLQYNYLDDGLYLTADALPQQKYFVRLNVDFAEMYLELDRYLDEAVVDYVLTSWRLLPEQFNRYQLVAQEYGYDDNGRLNKPLYLYGRVEE